MLVMVAIASLIPVPDVGVGDKFAHVATYIILAGWFSLLGRNPRHLLWTFAGLTVYGCLIEVLQGMTGYRTTEWGDVVANSLGLLVGILFYFSPFRRLLHYIDGRLALLCER